MRKFNFWSELKAEFNMNSDNLISSQIVLISFDKLYVEGVTTVSAIEDDHVDFKIKKQSLKVTGKKLRVVQMSANTLFVCGDINGVVKCEKD